MNLVKRESDLKNRYINRNLSLPLIAKANLTKGYLDETLILVK